MTFTALVFDQDSEAWWRFADPVAVLEANTPSELPGVLTQAEQHGLKGGYAVGFVTYEAASGFDPSLKHQPAKLIPLASFALFDNPTVIDVPDASVQMDFVPEAGREQFDTAFEQIKKHLLQGDSYQINYTHRLKGSITAPLESVFGAMLRGQPTPFGLMIESPTFGICSVSPELFFQRVGTKLTCEPMKGTRPRGRSSVEDQELRSDLQNSPKDRAENLMIVDMVRNDLGRIAEPGSVAVSHLFETRAYPTVWQQVSEVSAKVDAPIADIFAALFPCASVTGAPKTKSMEIIANLESSPRGVYTGALGVIKPGGDARFSVAIRTLFVDKASREGTFGVGGGIVWDSDVEEEWQESLTKASVLRHQPPAFQLLETMRYESETGIARRDYHMERLAASAQYFNFCFDSQAATQLLDGVDQDTGVRLRLLLARGGELELQQLPLPAVQRRMKLALASQPVDRSDPFLFHKTTARQVYDAAYQTRGEADDVILFNLEEELTETTISNLYLEIAGELLTPALSAGLLAGTYRRQMLAEGRAREARLTLSDLARADRLFVSNSLRGLGEAELLSPVD